MESKNQSQITFDFSEAQTQENASVGVRIKSIKPIELPREEPEAEPELDQIDEEPQATPSPLQEVMAEALTAVTEAPAAKQAVKKSTRGRKSLKALDAEADLVHIPADEILFQRQYYAIGEVAEMFGVNQSLLRFWENEFDIIQPRKNRKGDRHFRPVDIKNLELIYDLLRRRKLTIEGAKDFLKKNKQSKENFEMIQSLQKVKEFLLEIKAAL
ncbi:MerR family transcriptional regulator [Paraflavitalea sp. CAU 1676]|jgi:DNA-binding transcriptional MerR regulator|uniref:MerR family transcriptional regulator n=1 Tax=Paraflavitalea sp. CAU 1676 TaxID=3032598 RepID=UPI0023DB916D|nr:MerR family transcriptional regulator [Paraflavitalea sp. CAU 1676]MDF2193637.1 MerR family transcriptional regulator [Paraflavitalea sp. CAU 1676]